MSGRAGHPGSELDERNPARRVWHDWLVLGSIVAVTAVDVVRRDDAAGAAVAAALGLGLALVTLWRRTHPLATVVLGVGGVLVVDVASLVVAGEPFSSYVAVTVLVLVFSLFRCGSNREVVLGTAVVLALWLFTTVSDFTGATDAVGGLVILALFAAVGLALRYRGAVRAQELDRIRMQERELLARELHDTVAHHVSAIAIQAQAGEVLAESGDLRGAADALRTVSEEASRTMTEMRSVVGTLREGVAAPEASAQRTVADIERLGATEGTPGLRVDVERHGDLDGLHPAVATALYRVAQEAITNAQRHARNANRVHVVLSGDADAVRLTVDDDGGRSAPNPWPGYGLIGMNERVTLLGGTLDAGPRADHGWTVRATIPRQGRQA